MEDVTLPPPTHPPTQPFDENWNRSAGFGLGSISNGKRNIRVSDAVANTRPKKEPDSFYWEQSGDQCPEPLDTHGTRPLYAAPATAIHSHEKKGKQKRRLGIGSKWNRNTAISISRNERGDRNQGNDLCCFRLGEYDMVFDEEKRKI